MEVLIIITIIVQFILVLTNIIGLPGNIIAGLVPLIWFFSGHLTLAQLVIIILIIVAGEIFEFISGFLLGKNAGISNKSLLVSIFGAIALGIIMAPIFFGIGAIIGTFVGAFLGAFTYELLINRNVATAFGKGVVVFKSRVFGTVVKFSLGLFMIVLTAYFLL